ncbi:MAG: hypothetical protein WD793_14145 [Steroidobacteraceae bacterium]
MRRTRALIASVAAASCLAATPSIAHAQAWLPEKGSSSYSFDYTSVLNKKHYTPTGAEVDVGHTSIEILSIGGSYSPSDRVQISASLPYVNSRYIGPGGGGHDTEQDNGQWHGTVTDLQLTVHYQVTDGPIAWAPYIGFVIPTTDYETFGHSAAGRELEEYWLGFYAAASLNEWIPRTYVQILGNYAFVEKVRDIAHDRSNASLEIGHFLNDAWSLRALVTRQWTHGGIDVPVPLTSPLFPDHDRLAAEELLNVGAGVSWSLNERMSLYGLYLQSIEGTNAHKVHHRVSLGVSYGGSAH